MSYEWTRIHKTEEFYENQIITDVEQHVLDWYGVEEIAELSEDQIGEIQNFAEKISEYSVMQIGYSNIATTWSYAHDWPIVEE